MQKHLIHGSIVLITMMRGIKSHVYVLILYSKSVGDVLFCFQPNILVVVAANMTILTQFRLVVQHCELDANAFEMEVATLQYH